MTPSRVALVVVAALVAIALSWLAWIAAHVAWYRYHPPRETAFMAQRMAEAREKRRKIELRYPGCRTTVSATSLKRAMIAAEDAKFVEHDGFDWEGIELAQEKNQRRGPRRRRRLDDHAAAREEPVPLAREELLAQGRGGRDHA